MKNLLVFTVVFSLLYTKTYGLHIDFGESKYELRMGDVSDIYFDIHDDDNIATDDVNLKFKVTDPYVADFEGSSTVNISLTLENGHANYSIPISGHFLGHTTVLVELHSDNEDVNMSKRIVDVIVTRRIRAIDHAFTGSVAILVSLIYINFGCALNWSGLWPSLKRPIGPVVGILSQYLVMPVLSYVFGLLVFPDAPAMRLGLFVVGVSPAGGASNIWTCILDGNIDLSVTMTAISTLAAIKMMPLWLFTLGSVIFKEANIKIPYVLIGSLGAALLIPLFIGWLIQRFLPRVSTYLVRILKGFSSLLIAFIIVFAIATNLYLFELMSWKIMLAGLLLPWFGFAFGAALALLARQPAPDVLAIAIETGIQNTGMAIYMLRFALPQPEADLTTIVPVSVAIMTPIPLMGFYLYKRFCRKSPKEANLE